MKFEQGYAEDLNKKALEAKAKIIAGGPDALDASDEFQKLKQEAYDSDALRSEAEKENKNIDEKENREKSELIFQNELKEESARHRVLRKKECVDFFMEKRRYFEEIKNDLLDVFDSVDKKWGRSSIISREAEHYVKVKDKTWPNGISFLQGNGMGDDKGVISGGTRAIYNILDNIQNSNDEYFQGRFNKDQVSIYKIVSIPAINETFKSNKSEATLGELTDNLRKNIPFFTQRFIDALVTLSESKFDN